MRWGYVHVRWELRTREVGLRTREVGLRTREVGTYM